MVDMPPRQKFTKEEIVAAALNLVRREGMAGITARGLGLELGTSSRPIFTAFQNMEEVQQEVVVAARALYNGYIEKGLIDKIAFRGVGMQYFRFAKEEPRLFELLFMTSGNENITFEEILPAIDVNSDKILGSIHKEYDLSRELSYKLYQYLWLFTHGIACLCATGMGRLTEDKVETLLTEVFLGMLVKIKGREGEDKNA